MTAEAIFTGLTKIPTIAKEMGPGASLAGLSETSVDLMFNGAADETSNAVSLSLEGHGDELRIVCSEYVAGELGEESMDHFDCTLRHDGDRWLVLDGDGALMDEPAIARAVEQLGVLAH